MTTAIDQLITLVAQMRDPKRGCPWSREQTMASLASYTIEESYEFSEAVQSQNQDAIKDELSDLLLHVIFHAQLANEAGLFDLAEVAKHAVSKQLRRKPHLILDSSEHITMEQAIDSWRLAKQQERINQPKQSALDHVSTALPALTRAYRLQQQAALEGLDWQAVSGIFDKLHEELAELQKAMQTPEDSFAMTDELGDVLFTVINLIRFIGYNPETVLQHANQKFNRRFALVAKIVNAQHQKLTDLTEDELEAVWEQAKKSMNDVVPHPVVKPRDDSCDHGTP